MPGTSQTKAKNKYNAKAYDRVNLTVLKGKKGIINEIAEKKGKAPLTDILKQLYKRK